MSPIWPPPTTNPLHSTPKPIQSGRRCPPSPLISLFPNLSIFPSIYHSFSLQSHSFFLLLNVFILIFGWVKVYILKFSVIAFQNVTKHWKSFFELFFIAEPNTRILISLQNSFSHAFILHSKFDLHRTKRSLSHVYLSLSKLKIMSIFVSTINPLT